MDMMIGVGMADQKDTRSVVKGRLSAMVSANLESLTQEEIKVMYCIGKLIWGNATVNRASNTGISIDLY